MTNGAAASYYTLGDQRGLPFERRVAMRSYMGVLWLHGDHLGSASVAINLGGTTVGKSRYKPFGETRYTWGSTPTDRRFTGQLALDALGLYHYGARFYSPLLGRFLSADSIVPGAGNPQALNRYSMVFNNPLRYTDPSGHEPCAQYDATNECVVRYEALPRERVLRTRLGGYVDQQHAEHTNILAQVRSATRKPGGGSVYLDGLLQGEYMRIDCLIREGLSDDETVGVSLGILLHYENQRETKQGELGIRQPRSSYSLEDLPSEYLGFVQEATGYSLVDIVNHHLGGYDATYSEVAWIAHRILIGSPTNYETRPLEVDTSPVGFITGRHTDWPSTLMLGPPITGSSGLWRVLSTSHADQHSTGR